MVNSTRLSGNSLYAQAVSGLQSSYGYLMQGVTGKGLTLQNIINPTEDAKKSAYMNYNFSSYMASNFTSIDMDGDGVISQEDLTNYTNRLCTTGLTYSQIASLCSQGNTSSLLETVLNNFSEIDSNGDGRITAAEISGYGIEKEAEEIKEEYPKVDMDNITIFYKSSSPKTESLKKS